MAVEQTAQVSMVRTGLEEGCQARLVTMEEPYDEECFQSHCGIPYERNSHWLACFAEIADELIRSLRPQRVLDAGCAWGFLVEALRDRGIEAWGIDISPYAISNVRPDIKPCCKRASLIEPIDQRFDLITCIEVLEFIQPGEVLIAIRNLCNATDRILFSSTLDDVSEDIHFNVRPLIAWLRLFADFGFYPDLTYDASFLTPQAILLKRTPSRLSDEALMLFCQNVRLKIDAANEARRNSRLLEHARAEAESWEAAAAHAKQHATNVEGQLHAIFSSTSWKMTAPLRHLLKRAPWTATLLRRTAKLIWWTVTLQLPHRLRHRSQLLRRILTPQDLNTSATEYQQWIEKFDYSSADHDRYKAMVDQLAFKPVISVLMPVYETPATYLEEAIRSVRQQIYPHWELCIADDASTSQHVRQIIERHRREDSRIKVVYREANGHISEATNSAFELATGEFIALLDHDDLLRPHALAEVAATLNEHPGAQLIYSDEDKIEADRRFDPYFKPDWSPDLFLSQNYLNHLTVHRADNVRRVGGWRKGFEGSQDYDLNLRIIEGLDRNSILHIPKILYHWRAVPGSTAKAGSEKNYAFEAGKRALEEHVSRNQSGRIEQVEGLPFYRIVRSISDPQPLVSLIIPTKDKVDILRLCVNSILSKTTYTNFEILIVDNNSSEPTTLEYFRQLEQDDRIHVLHYPHAFNYSAINNFAAQSSKGSIIGLINNDVEVITPDWLREMVSHVVRPEVGCVGAKLYYPDDTVQHAGVILGIGGVAGHSHKYFPRSHLGYFGRLRLCQNVSAVTAACLLVRREIYEAVGGLDEARLKIAFNDVDFCLKVRQAGYLNVFTPFAELYHHESISRGTENTPAKIRRFQSEIATMEERWNADLHKDPFYSPNLTLDQEDFGFRTS
ncbi:glycosyltransferase [Microvirga arabica]|uniref:glycosyltransferase n=1 Tax=Microvirga arabica TaxID=1128671 RepID=UPI0019395C07|nr:glycosyltransferase [Microvirga arabica]MBM1175080.1 glycosyltransferase [Microvirga arabica]